MSNGKIIQEAFFALAGYRSPSLTKKEQNASLAQCWEILARAHYSAVEKKAKKAKKSEESS